MARMDSDCDETELEMASLLGGVDSFDEQEDELHPTLTSTPTPTEENKDTWNNMKRVSLVILLVIPWIIIAVLERKREAADGLLSKLRAETTVDVKRDIVPLSNDSVLNATDLDIAIESETNLTSAPSVAPIPEGGINSDTTLPPKAVEVSDMAADLFLIHTVYNDLHYRRVCAPVHSSHLCLTIRYPFAIKPQNPKYPFPKPVQERFYEEPVDVHFVDGKELSACKNQTLDSDHIDAVKPCIDQNHKRGSTATAVWSRHREGQTSLYGIDSHEQRRRMHKYFDHNVFLVLGASPSPPITSTLQQLFDDCKTIDKWDGLGSLHPFKGFQSLKQGQALCLPGEGKHEYLKNWKSLNEQDEWTVLLHDAFYPQDHGHRYFNHSIPPETSVALEMEKLQVFSHFKQMKFTIFVEHPIAHIQNQDLMQQSYDYIVSLQNNWTQVFLNATRGVKAKELRAKGLEFNIIAFDGSPQFFPTESGAYTGLLKTANTEEEFLKNGGYEGWKPELGSRCRGFLPPTSNLTLFNELGRDFYEKNGLDMRWYGRTWEFINLVWFSVKGIGGWGSKGLDCTHGTGAGSAVSNMHKYFVMAMIDDHFDNMT